MELFGVSMELYGYWSCRVCSITTQLDTFMSYGSNFDISCSPRSTFLTFKENSLDLQKKMPRFFWNFHWR
jgi:hypothetical protein